MDLTALHSFLRTKKEANTIVILVEQVEDALFKENFTLSSTLSKNTSYDLAAQIEKAIQIANINPDNKNELNSTLKNIKKEISELPIIHLMLAFSPNNQTVDMIHDWFYNNYKKIVLLDISVDKSIIAGSVISFKGRSQDYSLATQIGQMV